jgi:DNA-binding CsgD family transcriptional regulator
VPLTAIGEFTEAEALLLEDAEDMRAEDDRAWAVGVAVRRSRVHFAAGDISAAISEAESALSLAEKVGARLFVPVARRTLAAAAVHRGDFETATVELERFREEPAAAKVRHEASADAWVQARISYVFEGSAAAAKVLAPVFENLAANKRLLLEEPALAGWMVRSLLAAGDRNRAESVVDAARQLATNNAAYPSIGASLLHARGLLHDDPSDLVQASSEYAHPWARACAADDAATALTADGQLARGSQLLDAAIALYRQAGADHDAERARRRSEQPRAGATDQSGPPPVSGWWSLTDTERGVSELVAMGLTNSEIAARLFLSRFTVDFHLRKIFRKLDVHTRVEVARLAVEHQPSADD